MVAGFEPLDILQSIYMLMLQLSEGRSEVENQYSRVVPWDGNLVALKAIGETMELRPYFEWRGLGFISHSALQVRREYAAFDAELLFDVPGVRVADPKACQCGEVLKGVLKPWECKVFGTACTPETPIGTCMVSPEGACAAYYNFGRMNRQRVKEGDHRAMTGDQGAGWVQPRQRREQGATRPAEHAGAQRLAAPAGAPDTVREQQVLERIDRARRSRPRVREERITMSHGAGGKATRTLIEAVFLDAFRNPLLEPLEDAARLHGRRRAAGADHRLLRGLPAVLPRRRHRRPGRQRHGQRPGRVRRHPAVPVGRLHPRGRLPGRRPDPDRRARCGPRPQAAGVQVVTGDTKVVQRGKADGCYINTAGRRRCSSTASTLGVATRPARATRSSCPARSATTASRSCWPAASWTSRPTSSPTPRR